MQGWGLTDTLTFNYVGWTLSAEWFCYIALPVIVLAYRLAGISGLACLVVAICVALETATASGLMPFERWFLADTWGAFRAFADFAIGALVAMAVQRRAVALASHLPAWLCFAAAVAIMFWTSGSYLVLGLLALAIYLAATAESRNPAGADFLRPFDPLGRVSFSIYLIHPVVAALMFGGLWRTLIVSFYLYWFVPMIVVVGLALASCRWFETPVAERINVAFARFAEGRRPARPIPRNSALLPGQH